MRYRTRAGKGCRAKLVQVSERFLWNYKGSSLRTSLNAQSERRGERFAFVSPHAPGQPVGLSIIQISDVHHGVIDEPSAHPACRIRLAFHLLKPEHRVS